MSNAELREIPAVIPILSAYAGTHSDVSLHLDALAIKECQTK
jgi:hypothetical protein